MAVSVSAISSITKRYFFPKLVDNLTTSNALLMFMNKNGRMTAIDGGDDIRQPVYYAYNTSLMNYSGSETLSTAYQEKKTALVFDWKQKNVPITISGLDKLKNMGISKVVDHVKSEMQIAEDSMKDSFGTGLYSDGSTDPKEITGARAFLSTTNTYGGVDQSVESWLQAKIDSSTTTLTLAKMQERYEAAKEDNDRPNLVTTTETQFNLFWSLLQPQQRFSDGNTANAGFTNLMFNAAPVLEDSYCPSGYMVFWNLKYLKLVSHRERKFPGGFIDFEKPINQDVEVAHIRWAGELVCEQPRKFAAMTALT